MERSMPSENPSKDWQIDTVVKQLRSQAGASDRVAAQGFLHEDQVSGDLSSTASKLVSEASTEADVKGASIGRVSTLAQSFSLIANPDVFAALAKHAAVKAILPEQIEDVFPRPTRIISE